MRLALLLALGLALPPAAHAAAALEPRPAEEDEYGETFTFVADLDDGSYVQLQLAVTNLGPGSRSGLCRALVRRPTAKAWSAFDRVGEGRWSWTGGDEERLSVGACWARSGPSGTRVHVALDRRTVELAFPRPLDPRPAPGSPLPQDGRALEIWTTQAFTPVTASLELPGAPRVELGGGGYADHSRSTVIGKTFARRWLRFRALKGSSRLLFAGLQTPQGATTPVWLWREGAPAQILTGFTLARSGGTPSEPTWKASLAGPEISGTMTSTSVVYRHAPVEEFGGTLARLLKPVVGSPVTWTHRAQLSLDGGPAIDGILEVQLSDE